MQDIVENLSRLIREAAQQKRPLCIRGGGTKDFMPYVLMIAVLMVRPYGIFGKRRVERV